MKKLAFPKKSKRPSRTRLKRKADKLFSEIVRRPGYCLHCGSTQNLQCAHIISRSYKTTRWDTQNAVCLCRACHMYFTHHPIEWEDWINKQIGEDKYKALRQRALIHQDIDYEAILSRLEERAAA